MAIDTLKQQIEVVERNIHWKENDIEMYTQEISEAEEFIKCQHEKIKDMKEAIEILGGNHDTKRVF